MLKRSFVGLALLVACGVNESAKIPCYDDYACPAEYPVCQGASASQAGVCIKADGTHTPATTSVAVVGVEGAAHGATARGTVNVQVVARATAGVKSVSLAAGGTQYALASSAPPLYVFAVDTGSADGTLSLIATLQPADGSAAINSDPFTLSFDNTSATLSIASLTPADARPGSVVTLDVTSSEDLADIAAVTDKGPAFSRADALAHSYRLIFPITASTPAGAYAVTVTAHDVAGNASSLAGPSFTVRQPFQLDSLKVAGSFEANGTFGSPIRTTLTLPASVETGSAAPMFVLTDSAGNARAFAGPATHADAAGERTWTIVDAVTEADASGPAEIVATVTDLSGNSASLKAEYGIDKTPPLATGFDFALASIDAPHAPQGLSGFASKPLASVTATTTSGDAASCAFDDLSVPAPIVCTIGVTDVAAAQSVTATLTLTDLVGNVSTADATYQVVPLPSAQALALGAGAITAGASTTLTPGFADGSGAIDGLGAVVSGNAVTVSPLEDTTYTLTVTNAAGSTDVRTATLHVLAPPAISSFSVSGPAVVTAGGASALVANFSGGTATIDHGVGAVTSGVPVSVTPNATTTYTLTVTNGATSPATTTQTATVTVVPAPSIAGFTAADSVIAPGASTTLIASFSNGAGSVDHGVGSVPNGAPISVSPGVTTTYTLTVTNGATTPATASAQVTVHVAPAIASFSAAPATISAGSSAVLSASFSGGAGVVTPGNLSIVNGTPLTVTPAATTTYTLTVTGPDQVAVQSSATVTVVPVPSVTSFVTGAAVITQGASTTITPTFAAGQTAVIDHGIGAATSGQAVTVAPAATTTWHLTVTNAAGDTASASVTVGVVAPPSIASFIAGAPTISAGDSVQLTGIFGGGTGVVDQGVGSVTTGTAKSVSPAATTTYTLTVTNAATTPASVSAAVTVAVISLPHATSLSASRSTITAGDTVQLTPVFDGGAGVVDGVGAVTSSVSVSATPAATTTYTLTVTNALGRTATVSTTVTVLPMPAVQSFTSTTPIVDASATSLSFNAVFSNGNGSIDHGAGAVTSNVLKTVPFTPPAPPATITYTLTVTNAQNASVTASVSISVVANASASLSAAAGTITSGGSTALTPTFGAGQSGVVTPGNIPAASGQAITVSPASDTTYTLTVTDSGGGQTTATATVHVVAMPSISSFTAAPSTTDSAHSVQLTPVFAGGAGVINPGNISATTGSAVTVSPSSSTTYTLAVTNAATSPFVVSAQAAVTVVALPTAALTASASDIVAGQSVTLTPTFSGGTAVIDSGVGAVTGAVSVTPAVTTTYTLTTTNALGSTATSSVTVHVVAITSFAATTPNVDSQSATVQFSATFAGGSGTITPGGVNISSGGTAVVAAPSANTTYTLTVTNADNFTTTATALVTFVALPSGSLSAAPSTITAGGSALLTPTFGAGQSAAIDHSIGAVTSGQAVTVAPAHDTTYTLTITNAAGHSATTTASVAVVAAPVINSFSASGTSVPSGSTLTLSFDSTGGNGVIAPGSSAATGAGQITVTAPTVASTQNATWTLTVTNAAGTAVSQSVTVQVTPLPTASLTLQGASPVAPHADVTLTPVFTNGTGSVDGVAATSNAPITFTNLVASRTFTLTVTSPSGATATATATATVQATIDSFATSLAYFKQGTTASANLTAFFEGSGASGDAPATVSDGTNSFSVLSGVAHAVSPTTTTTYTLTVTGTGSGNNATQSLTITALPTPPAALSASSNSIVRGNTVTLTPTFAGSGLTGVLSNNSDSSRVAVTSGTPVTLAPSASTVYTLTVTNLAGDTATAAQTVAVIAAPDAPTTVAATAGVRSATLSWAAGASNGSPITSYIVLQSSGGSYTPASAVVSGVSATVSGLSNGVTYTFEVVATNAVGSSLPSAPSNAVTTPMVPGAPSITSVIGGNAQASLTWAAGGDGGSPITGFIVSASPGGATMSTASTSLTFNGLTNGVSYTFTVSSVNAVGIGAPSIASGAVTPSTTPDAPGGVSATAGVASATVTWTAPFDEGSAITSYTVLQSLGAGGFGSAVASVTGTTATVTGLTANGSYRFEVVATNGNGDSAASAPSAAIVIPDVPGAPFGVIAVAGNGTATISWSAPASNGGSPITKYTVTASSGGFSTTTTGATTATLSGLTNGQTYTFTVFATNAVGDGTVSAASNSVTPATLPGTPTAVSAAAGVRSANLSWTAPAGNGSPIYTYNLTQSLNGGAFTAATASVGGAAATVTGLSNGGSYQFQVQAVNSVGAGSFSASSNTVTLPDVPGAPGTVSATPGDQQVLLSWTASAANGSAVTSYAVTIHGGSGTVTPTGTLSATITGLTNGTSYTFDVQGMNAAGTGAAGTSNSVTPAGAPAAPTNVEATAGVRSATVVWTAPSSNGSAITAYNVFQSTDGTSYTASTAVITGTSAAVSNLTNGGQYTFKVSATNGAGTGPLSSASSQITLPNVPGAPTSASATASSGVATVTFSAPASDGGSPITLYTVTSNPGGVTATNTSASVTIVTGLSNGTSYTFTVTATNAVGTGAASTASNTVTPTLPPVGFGPKGGVGFPNLELRAGNRPVRTVVADLNGDGRPDLVVANTTDNTLGVYLANDTGGYSTATTYATGSAPRAIGVGDFNRDGKLDLVVGNNGGATVSVFLNTGNGQFATGVTWSTGSAPMGLAVGDFNGDGKLDLATADDSGGTLSVLFGNGGGSFAAPVSYGSGGTGPTDVVAGDFNGDGKLDLAVANAGSNTIAIFLNDGAGVFTRQSPLISTSGYAWVLKAADLNGDGILDLVSANNSGNSISVFLGTGGAAFAAPASYATGLGAYYLDVADLNGDGKLDVVVPNQNDKTVSVLLNNGNGTFAPQVQYLANRTPQSVSLADLNGDGRIDMLVSDFDLPGTLNVFWNTGGGNFAQSTSFAVGANPGNVVVGDFNGDGKLDFADSSYNTGGVSIYLGQGGGNFTLKTTVATAGNLNAGVAGDFNRDGKLDLAFPDATGNRIFILLGNGDGTFTTSIVTATHATPVEIAAADMNGDGKLDLVITCTGANAVDVFLGDGAGGFVYNGAWPTGSHPLGVALGDFDADGKIDIAVSNHQDGTVEVLRNLGGNSFATGVTYPTPDSNPFDLAVADFNGDGKPDLVVANSGSSRSASVFLNNGNGTFAAAVNYANSGVATYVAAGDFNNDGKPDFAVTDQTNGRVNVFLNNGDGSFAAALAYHGKASNFFPNALAAGDFDGDGRLDLAEQDGNNNTVEIALDKWTGECGSGTFGSSSSYTLQSSPFAVATADFNGDGRPDLAAINASSNTLSVLIANGSGGFAGQVTYATGNIPDGIAAGDLNGDGKPDIVVAISNSGGSGGGLVQVYFNNGNGTFAAPVNYGAGANTAAVAIADVNGDGRPDVVATDAQNNIASVFLNAGGGALAAKVDYATGSDPLGLSLGDLNGDGKLDIVTANTNSANISVLMNNGDGTFAAKVDYPAGSIPREPPVLRDFDGDGKLDVAVSTEGDSAVSVFHNTGSGVLAAKVSYPTGSAERGLAGVDVNGDGKVDLVVTSNSSGTLGVLLNDGSGVFTLASTYSLSGGAWNAPVVADFSGDGKPDIAVLGISGGKVTVLVNDGNQTCGSLATMQFAAAANYSTEANPENICVGDLNGDGKQDVVVANYGAFTTGFFTGSANGALNAMTSHSAASYTVSPVVADLNRDGRNDVVIGEYNNGTVSVYFNQGGGVFSAPQRFSLGFGAFSGAGPYSNGVAVADFNLDGKLDIVASNDNDGSAGNVAVLLGDGAGGFGSPISSPIAHAGGIAVGDVDGDGKLDLVVGTYGSGTPGMRVLIGKGDGTFQAGVLYPTGASRSMGVALGDLNGDGKPDVVQQNDIDNTLSVFLNNGDGTFTLSRTVAFPGSYFGLGLADLNGDGKLDVLNGGVGNTFEVLFSLGNGRFAPHQTYNLPSSTVWGINAVDLNGDGKLDVVVEESNVNQVQVFLRQ